MRFRGIRLRLFLLVLMFAGVLFGLPHAAAVYGAQREIYFGSESYDAKAGEDFSVGVYINSDEAVGAYRLTVEYDAAVLRYVSGADADEGGRLVISGETGEQEMRRMLEFSLVSDVSSYLRLSSEGEPEEAVWAPVLAVGEDDSLTISGLHVKPDGIGTFESGQRVYALTLETPGELEAIEAQAPEGVSVTLPDIAALHAGKNILTIYLQNENGGKGRCYLLVDVVRQEAELPVFSWERQEWQVLDGKTCAAAYFTIPYETATYSLDGVGMDFICNAAREVFLVFAQSPEGEICLFAYNLNDGSFYPCGELTTEEQSYYTIPVDALVALPSSYSPTLLTSQGVFAGLNQEGAIGLYLVNVDGELTEYVLGNQETFAGEEEKAPEKKPKSRGWLVLAVLLAAAAAGMSFAYRKFSDVRLLMGAAASGFVMILAICIWFVPQGSAEAEPVGSGGEPVISSGSLSLQPQVPQETVDVEPEEENMIWGEIVDGESEPDNVTPGQAPDQGAGADGSENGRAPQNNGGTHGNGGGNGGNAAPPAGGDVYTPPAWGDVYTPPAGDVGNSDTPPVGDGGVDIPPVTDDDGKAPPVEDGGNGDTPPVGGGGVDTPPVTDDDGEAPPAGGEDNTGTPPTGDEGNSETPPAGGGESVSGTEGI